jgi:hypothetical protein
MSRKQRFAVREVSSSCQLYESEADSLYETLLSAQLTIQHVFEAGLFVKRVVNFTFSL